MILPKLPSFFMKVKIKTYISDEDARTSPRYVCQSVVRIRRNELN